MDVKRVLAKLWVYTSAGLVAAQQFGLLPALAAAADEPGGAVAAASAPGGVSSCQLGAAPEASESEKQGHDDAVNVSLDLMAVAGGSDIEDEALGGINGGGHDPLRNGFTLQQAELAVGGRIDDWLRADIHAVRSEEGLELEEACLSASEGAVEARLGLFSLPFGLHNHRHPHGWTFLDQNLAVTRMFGGEGARGEGAGLTWQLAGAEAAARDAAWRSTLYIAVQHADHETMGSFRGAGLGGDAGVDPLPAAVDALAARYGELGVGNRPRAAGGRGRVCTARWENAWNPDGATRVQAGLSAAWGDNASGLGGKTRIYGADFSLKWQPSPDERWPFVLWETEYLARRYGAAEFTDNTDPLHPVALPAAVLRDWAWYTQALYGFAPGWAAGLRYERADGNGESIGGRALDPLRDGRTRVSPLLACWPEEQLRLRLQCNFDRAQHLAPGSGGGTSRSWWLGAEWMLGEHRHAPADEEFEVPGDAAEEAAH